MIEASASGTYGCSDQVSNSLTIVGMSISIFKIEHDVGAPQTLRVQVGLGAETSN